MPTSEPDHERSTPAPDSTPRPPNDDELGTTMARLARPFTTLIPFMLVVLVPAAVYGYRSLTVAESADDVLESSFVTAADESGMTIPTSALCDPSAAETLTTSFAAIDLDGETHKSSISGLGFDTVIVDLKGWVDEPSGQANDLADPTTGDSRDDITVRLERRGGEWCVIDVDTATSEPQASSDT